MSAVALPAKLPFYKGAMYFAQPFLSINSEGTVIMSFSEGFGTKEKRASYVWSGNRVRLVERVQMRLSSPSQ
jgi:hypothetical protein